MQACFRLAWDCGESEWAGHAWIVSGGVAVFLIRNREPEIRRACLDAEGWSQGGSMRGRMRHPTQARSGLEWGTRQPTLQASIACTGKGYPAGTLLVGFFSRLRQGLLPLPAGGFANGDQVMPEKDGIHHAIEAGSRIASRIAESKFLVVQAVGEAFEKSHGGLAGRIVGRCLPAVLRPVGRLRVLHKNKSPRCSAAERGFGRSR